MSGSGHGKRAVLAAAAANLGIAVAKFIGFLITGSSALLAETIHSVADTGNQGLLLLGERRASREADEEHPFGYGRERFFYAFVVALVLFSLGALFALYEGIQKLRHPHELDSPLVAVGLLLVAVVLEALSIRTAIHEARPLKGDIGWWEFIRRAKNPELPVVLLEDLGALVGLAIALVGVALVEITGNADFDAVSTLGISVLLGVIAVVLALEMKSLLIGESATAATVGEIRAALRGAPAVRRAHPPPHPAPRPRGAARRGQGRARPRARRGRGGGGHRRDRAAAAGDRPHRPGRVPRARRLRPGPGRRHPAGARPGGRRTPVERRPDPPTSGRTRPRPQPQFRHMPPSPTGPRRILAFDPSP